MLNEKEYKAWKKEFIRGLKKKKIQPLDLGLLNKPK